MIAELVAAAHSHGVNWTEVGTISGLVIGGVGALAAGVGLRYQGQQHRRLTRELAKRADFEVTVARNPAVGGVEPGPNHPVIVRSTASGMNLRFQIGLRNSGSLGATHVSVDFLTAAQGAGGLYWTDEEGNPDAGRERPGRDERATGSPVRHDAVAVARAPTRREEGVDAPLRDARGEPLHIAA